MWTQTKTPKLNHGMEVTSGGKKLTDWNGWCLAVTQTCIGVKPFAANAKKAWDANKTKHTDAIPEGVWVIVWYTNCVFDGVDYGHCEWVKRTGNNYEVWTSPLSSHKADFDVIKCNLTKLKSLTVGKYAGWTETLNGTRFVKWEEPKVEEPKVEEPKEEPKVEPNPEEPKETTTDAKTDGKSEVSAPTNPTSDVTSAKTDNPYTVDIKITIPQRIILAIKNIIHLIFHGN